MARSAQVDPELCRRLARIPIVLASSPWGARLISQGQQVQVMSEHLYPARHVLCKQRQQQAGLARNP